MNKVYLSRRNLLTLLAKLDKNKAEPDSSVCTLLKQDTVHPKFPCSTPTFIVALEDEEYYTDRRPGPTVEDSFADLINNISHEIVLKKIKKRFDGKRINSVDNKEPRCVRNTAKSVGENKE